MKIRIPFNQYRTSSIIQYSQWDRNYQFDKEPSRHDITKEKTYSGTVTEGAKKRIQKAVSILVQGSQEKWIQNTVTGKRQKFKISFITLTVSETERNLTAKEAHKLLLEPFIRHFRDKYGMRTYIWKAELQKRGQIHYHLTTNVFIEFYHLRDQWNKLQRKAGLLESFNAKYGHYNPNSIDVHSVYKIRNLEAYLIKYLSKAEADKGKTEGKIWDCSQNLKKAKYFTIEQDYPSSEKIEQLVSKGKIIVKECEMCHVLLLKNCRIPETLTPHALQLYAIWKQQLNL